MSDRKVEALACLREVERRLPSQDANAWLVLHFSAEDLGQRGLAATALDRAFRSAPKANPEVLLRLAPLAAKEQAAKLVAQAAREVKPEQTDLCIQIADLLGAYSDRGQAVELLRRAAACASSNNRPMVARQIAFYQTNFKPTNGTFAGPPGPRFRSAVLTSNPHNFGVWLDRELGIH